MRQTDIGLLRASFHAEELDLPDFDRAKIASDVEEALAELNATLKKLRRNIVLWTAFSVLASAAVFVLASGVGWAFSEGAVLIRAIGLLAGILAALMVSLLVSYRLQHETHEQFYKTSNHYLRRLHENFSSFLNEASQLSSMQGHYERGGDIGSTLDNIEASTKRAITLWQTYTGVHEGVHKDIEEFRRGFRGYLRLFSLRTVISVLIGFFVFLQATDLVFSFFQYTRTEAAYEAKDLLAAYDERLLSWLPMIGGFILYGFLGLLGLMALIYFAGAGAIRRVDRAAQDVVDHIDIHAPPPTQLAEIMVRVIQQFVERIIHLERER